jgi:hypothetical protein
MKESTRKTFHDLNGSVGRIAAFLKLMESHSQSKNTINHEDWITIHKLVDDHIVLLQFLKIELNQSDLKREK